MIADNFFSRGNPGQFSKKTLNLRGLCLWKAWGGALYHKVGIHVEILGIFLKKYECTLKMGKKKARK